MSAPIVQYQTLASNSEGLYKEKGSKFISYAFPVRDENEVENALAQVKDIHPKARHFCYAYRLGADGKAFRQNDDGEPSGTAGKPIYGQLLSFDLTNCLVIVVRYFGGTKLGASGLITAYKTAAQDALEQANIITKSIQQLFEMEMDYERLPMMLEAIKNAEVTIIDKVFQASAKIVIAIGIDQIQRDWNQIATLFVGHNTDQKDLIENHDIKINTMQKRAI